MTCTPFKILLLIYMHLFRWVTCGLYTHTVNTHLPQTDGTHCCWVSSSPNRCVPSFGCINSQSNGLIVSRCITLYISTLSLTLIAALGFLTVQCSTVQCSAVHYSTSRYCSYQLLPVPLCPQNDRTESFSSWTEDYSTAHSLVNPEWINLILHIIQMWEESTVSGEIPYTQVDKM